MKSMKLGICLVAASVSLGGAALLAEPLQAAEPTAPCSAGESAFASGYASGYCSANGYSSGTVTSCQSNGDGTITISGTCS